MRNKMFEGVRDFLEMNTSSNVPPNYSEEEEDDADSQLDELLLDLIDEMETPEAVNEISYREFVNDESKTARQKVNGNVKKIKSKLVEIKRLCRHAAKLKNDLPSDQKVFWKSTFKQFGDIKSRIDGIKKMVIELTK